jgi:hypothetical protein
MRKLNVLEFFSLDGVLQAPGGPEEDTSAASGMAGGRVHRKRLFGEDTIPAAFKVTQTRVTSKGVIIVNYERAGAVPTGSP